jgi:hypothetical protein
MTVDNLILKAEEMVKEYMSRFDSSHDFLHVDRVRRSGKKYLTWIVLSPLSRC